MLQIILMLGLTGAQASKSQVAQVHTCQWPNKCEQSVQVQPCNWPNKCEQTAQVQPCNWPNKCSIETSAGLFKI